jgi:hypothetical protein
MASRAGSREPRSQAAPVRIFGSSRTVLSSRSCAAIFVPREKAWMAGMASEIQTRAALSAVLTLLLSRAQTAPVEPVPQIH